MGQAKQRGTYEERVATARPRKSQRNGFGRFKRSREQLIHISQDYVWDKEKKEYSPIYLNQVGGARGVTYSPHKQAAQAAKAL